MADGRCSNSAENDVVELEAMRKGSFSWHPCQVSVCSRGLGLVVRYGDNDLEETLEDKQEIFTRVRLRSTPLQGDDCSYLQQGDQVLATQNLHVDPVFYDALVEEAIRVRHSKRSHCRCSFKIKWLHLALEETVTVPASAIMRLATKSINLNPTISTFFSKLEYSNGLDTQQHLTFVDSLNWEMDINVLLEKQIEEISNFTDASQEKISKNFIFGLEVDLKGQSHGMSIDASLKDPPDAIPLLNNLKGSTGSKNKQQMETIFEIPAAFVSSVQEKFTESRSPLSPLAARAALASLRSEFPQNTELSVKSNVDKGDITSVQSATTNDFLLTVSATLEGKSSKHETTAKTLFPTSGAPQIVEFSNVSSIEAKGKKNKISKTRFTRAQIQSNNGMHESSRTTNSKATQLRSSTRRVTRSAANRAENTEVEEYNAEVEEQTKCVELDISARNAVAPQNCSSDHEKPVASPVDGDNEKNHLGKDGLVAKFDSQKGTFAEDVTKHSYPKKLTRSVSRGEAKRNNVQPKQKSTKTDVSESNELDLFVENVSTESNKSRETVPHIKTTPSCTESVAGSIQGIKRKSASSKKQETTRFSPRRRFLPRTRSQSKA